MEKFQKIFYYFKFKYFNDTNISVLPILWFKVDS